jgi:glutathione synthase/RimK-type ligase-like ATP-grasp enzyme
LSNLTLVVDKLTDWTAYYPSSDVATANDYLESKETEISDSHVINLCRSYKYLSHGYYCSLMAEARGQKVIPSIRTINNLSKKNLYALELEDLNQILNRLLKNHHSEDKKLLNIKVFFGQCIETTLQDIARQVFELFPCPILEVQFKKSGTWSIYSIRSGALNNLTEQEEDLFATGLDLFSKKIWRKPRARKLYRYDLAILVDPNEELPPSNKRALKSFEKAGRELGIDVDFITKKDLGKLAEYDALFIRETTGINNHTYQFAKRAESESMVVIDDPESILRCTNKVYLAKLLEAQKIATPKSLILSNNDKNALNDLIQQIDFPLVLKIPDGSFSRGIVKIKDEAELKKISLEYFKKSALILAQEFYFTEYDWRIGIFNGKAIFACQYFMSKGHWQIYNHKSNGRVQSGGFATIPVNEAPKHVINNAIKASRLIGKGLYGVDIKQRGNQSVIIEVNDNPNIDAGVEDVYLGFELYRQIMQEFLRRLELKRQGNATRL